MYIYIYIYIYIAQASAGSRAPLRRHPLELWELTVLHYREVVVVLMVIAKGIIIVGVFKCFVRFLL